MRGWLRAGLLALAVSLAATACPMRVTLPPATPLDPRAPPPTDQQLTAAVQARIDYNWVLGQRDIRISTHDRVVSLVGWVVDVYERDLAEQIVRTTPGVAGLDDDLRLTRQY